VITLDFLGTGTSTGVPVIGCDCEVCTSPDPRDARLRSSVVVRQDGTTVLVDTSPDLRAQLLRDPVPRIDAILFTHAHADHTAGLDELRRYNAMQQEHLPVWASRDTAENLQRRFDYAFVDQYPVYGVIPDLTLHVFEDTRPFRAGAMEIVPVPVMHGRLPILGYRFGSIAYLTDVKTIPERSLPLLRDLDVLVLTALRHHPHPAHMSLDEALAAVEMLQPRHTLFTHVAHDMGRYEDVAPTLPPSVALATDGLRVVVDDDPDRAGRVQFTQTASESRSRP
jgi:phosphoribosyl 1,2-cyclic phosphate phosphodiesterase